ncbi:class I SAM-dependent methyltransferase [Rhodoflexus sp.]
MGVIPSWKTNAARWIQAIEQNEIVSRQLATNQAIIDEILALQPQTVLDMGCGEGWLVRALAARGIVASGTDATAEFISYATAKGNEQYFAASYEDIVQGQLSGMTFDAIVFNFSLFEKEGTEQLMTYLPRLLNAGGHVVIQTLHPLNLPANVPYISHWEQDSWKGLGNGFTEPHPWYFRTIGDWVHLITMSGFQLAKISEPLHPETQKPLSMIIIGKKV